MQIQYSQINALKYRPPSKDLKAYKHHRVPLVFSLAFHSHSVLRKRQIAHFSPLLNFKCSFKALKILFSTIEKRDV